MDEMNGTYEGGRAGFCHLSHWNSISVGVGTGIRDLKKSGLLDSLYNIDSKS